MIESVLNRIIEHLGTHKIQDGTLVVGGSAAVTDPSTVASFTGDWLMTHGIGVLTYGELIRVIGAVGVVVAILNVLGFFKFVGWAFSRITQA